VGCTSSDCSWCSCVNIIIMIVCISYTCALLQLMTYRSIKLGRWWNSLDNCLSSLLSRFLQP
jgi:hypothetical protein